MVNQQKTPHSGQEVVPQKRQMEKSSKNLLIYCGVLIGVLLVAAPIIILVRKNATPETPSSGLASGNSSSPDMSLFADNAKKKKSKDREKTADRSNSSTSAEKQENSTLTKSNGVNFNFETGDLQGAIITDGEFKHVISNRKKLWKKSAKYKKEGTYFLTTHEVGDPKNKGEDKQTGTITSPVFKLEAPILSLLIGGGQDKHNVYFAMYLENGTEIYRVSSPRGGQQFTRINTDLSEYLNKKVYWQVVDDSTIAYGFITVDDIHFYEKSLLSTQ